MLTPLQKELLQLISDFIVRDFGKKQSFQVNIFNDTLIIKNGSWSISTISEKKILNYTHNVGTPLINIVRTIYSAKSDEELYDVLPTLTKNLPSLLFFISSNPLRDLNILLSEWIADARLDSLRASPHSFLNLLLANLKARFLRMMARLHHLHSDSEILESTDSVNHVHPECASFLSQTKALDREKRDLSPIGDNYSKAELVRFEREYPRKNSVHFSTVTCPNSVKDQEEMIKNFNKNYNGGGLYSRKKREKHLTASQERSQTEACSPW